MPIDTDWIEAIREILIDDLDLSALVSTRIYGLELPRADTKEEVQKSIVLQYVGGGGSNDYVELGRNNMDMLCYGETLFEADKVRRTANPVLKQLIRENRKNVLIHSALKLAGPFNLRDRDNDWPLVTETWQIIASEITAISP